MLWTNAVDANISNHSLHHNSQAPHVFGVLAVLLPLLRETASMPFLGGLAGLEALFLGFLIFLPHFTADYPVISM